MRAVALLVAVAAALAAGCGSNGSSSSSPKSSDARAIYVPLPTGGRVMCVIYRPSTSAAALSCDWGTK